MRSEFIFNAGTGGNVDLRIGWNLGNVSQGRVKVEFRTFRERVGRKRVFLQRLPRLCRASVVRATIGDAG